MLHPFHHARTTPDKPALVMADSGVVVTYRQLEDQASISIVARRNGVAPNLLYRWRRLMLEGGSVAVTEDDDVTSNRVVRQLEDRIRELERYLGRKTLEAEILREALDKSRSKKLTLHARSSLTGGFR